MTLRLILSTAYFMIIRPMHRLMEPIIIVLLLVAQLLYKGLGIMILTSDKANGSGDLLK